MNFYSFKVFAFHWILRQLKIFTLFNFTFSETYKLYQKMLNQVFILILLLLFFFNSEAQKKFNVTIEFPNNIDCKKIKFQYDN